MKLRSTIVLLFFRMTAYVRVRLLTHTLQTTIQIERRHVSFTPLSIGEIRSQKDLTRMPTVSETGREKDPVDRSYSHYASSCTVVEAHPQLAMLSVESDVHNISFASTKKCRKEASDLKGNDTIALEPTSCLVVSTCGNIHHKHTTSLLSLLAALAIKACTLCK